MSDRVARQPATTAGSEASNHPEEQQAETRRVEVRRSRRRRSTVSAYREGDTTIVSIPARFTVRQEREWVNTMMTRLDDKEARRRPSDDELMARAQELSQRYLGGKQFRRRCGGLTSKNVGGDPVPCLRLRSGFRTVSEGFPSGSLITSSSTSSPTFLCSIIVRRSGICCETTPKPNGRAVSLMV